MSQEQKKVLIVGANEECIPIFKQCELLGIARSSFYYAPIPVSTENLELMKKIDLIYLEKPFYGSRRVTEELARKGEYINRKRTQRLMRIMGLETIYPKRRINCNTKDSYKYPHLLKGLKIIRPNQVWGTDITYIPVGTGYLYLVAIVDLYSRFIVSWELSNNLESDFCIRALEEGLKGGVRPEILNSDQGSQYTSKAYTGILKDSNIAISMSGKGRCWDNIFVERLWRTLKYEEVYLKDYSTGKEAQDGINMYLNFYNKERIHTSLSNNTPWEVYYDKKIA